MRICVDLTSLSDNFSGIERFASSITKELIKNREYKWILLFKNDIYRAFKDEYENVEKIVIKGSNKLIFNQVILPINLLRIKADRYFFPAFPAPFFFFNKNVFNTIHDLSCWDCPESNKKHMIWYFKIMYWKAALNGKQVITVSEFSKNRIKQILKVKEENITVVYNGISKQFDSNAITGSDEKKIKKKYLLPKKYVLCLSTLEPRKNLKLLLDGYEELFKNNHIEEIVLAGRKGWKMDNFLKGYDREFLRHVHFTGFIADEDLSSVYKLAEYFVFPSLYEGFGIPPLEALACGTRVVSSDAASLPEVLGEAVIYFKSQDVDDLKRAVRRENYLLGAEKSRYVKNGIYQSQKYRWDKEAQKLQVLFKEKYEDKG